MSLLCIFSGDISGFLLSKFDDVMQLANLCGANRELRTQITNAKSAWLDVAKRVTGYDNVPFSIRSVGFWYKLKLLLCPWLSMNSVIAIKHEMASDVKMTFADDKLFLRMILFNGGTTVVSCTAIPGKNVVWERVTDSSATEFNDNCDQYYEGEHYHMSVPIHASAIAVAEFYDEYAFPRGAEGRNNGIYIVSPRKNVALKYLRLGRMQIEIEYALCSAPCRMWVSTDERVHYFGPRKDRRLVEDNFTTHKAVFALKKGRHEQAINSIPTIDHRTFVENRTILQIAVHECRLEAARAILGLNADPNVIDSFGITPLMIAAGMCDLDMIRLLVENGADLNVTHTVIGSALHFIGEFLDSQSHLISSARRDGRANADEGRTYDTLVQCGCDPEIRDGKGVKAQRTP
jgi:hypothetical protein